MFIERLRHIKSKWKIPAMCLIGLLVIGLLSSFAYLGQSFGGSGGADTDTLKYYETAVENGEKAVKKEETPENLLTVIQALDSYAAYQILYLDDEGAKESYAKELEYTKSLLAQYGKTETTKDQWKEAYNANVRANMGTADVESARKAFQESLTKVTITSEYINSYSQILMGKKLYNELMEDLAAAAAIVEPMVEESDEAEGEEDAVKDENAPETPAAVLDAINSGIQYAQMMYSMENPENAPADQGDKE